MLITHFTGALTNSIGRLTRTMGAKRIVVMGSTAAKSLKTLLISKLKEIGLYARVSLVDEYKGFYKGKPHINLYVCKLAIG